MDATKFEVDLRNYFLGLIKNSKHYDYLPKEEKEKFKKWLTCVDLRELAEVHKICVEENKIKIRR